MRLRRPSIEGLLNRFTHLYRGNKAHGRKAGCLFRNFSETYLTLYMTVARMRGVPDEDYAVIWQHVRHPDQVPLFTVPGVECGLQLLSGVRVTVQPQFLSVVSTVVLFSHTQFLFSRSCTSDFFYLKLTKFASVRAYEQVGLPRCLYVCLYVVVLTA